MPEKIPITNKSADITKLLKKLPAQPVPLDLVTPEIIKSMGFSVSSSAKLLEILKIIGFVNEAQRVTPLWSDFVSSDDRARILAAAVKSAYPGLFHEMMCPYLVDDKDLLDYFKRHVDASRQELEYGLETFRALCEFADFQDSLDDYDVVEPALTPQLPQSEALPQLKVDPNVQMNIQIHIDPNTSDEKIETIFKYMRKYLLGKD